MTLPVRRPVGSLMERSFPGFGRSESVAAESDELFERMNRLLQGVATSPAAPAWSPAADAPETDAACLIEAELPGIRRDGIVIEITRS